MTIVLPSHLTYGKVVARWIKAIGDTPEDPDKLPEAIAVQGKVSLYGLVSRPSSEGIVCHITQTLTEQTGRITPNLPVLYITKNRSK